MLRAMFQYPRSVFILKMLLPIFDLADFSAPYGLPLLALLLLLAAFGMIGVHYVASKAQSAE